jgi:hypothetical protein
MATSQEIYDEILESYRLEYDDNTRMMVGAMAVKIACLAEELSLERVRTGRLARKVADLEVEVAG